MNTIVDHRSLVDALGGNTVVAGIYPVPPVRVGQWKISNRIPPDYWPELIRFAAEKSLTEIDADWLMRTTPPRQNAFGNSDDAVPPSTGQNGEMSPERARA